MNVLINLLMGGAITVGVYLGMIGAHVDEQTALSTAVLVAATAVVPALKSDQLYSKVAARRKTTFEKRLDASEDHVKHIVKKVVEEVLPHEQDGVK